MSGYPRADLPKPVPPPEPWTPEGLQYRVGKQVDGALELWDDALGWALQMETWKNGRKVAYSQPWKPGFEVNEDGEAVFEDGTKVVLNYSIDIVKPCLCEGGQCLQSEDLLHTQDYYCKGKDEEDSVREVGTGTGATGADSDGS